MNIRVYNALRKVSSMNKEAGIFDGISRSFNKITGGIRRGYDNIADDAKHTIKGFQWRHMLPDGVAKHVLRDYAPGNIDPLDGPKMEHKNVVEFLSGNKNATAFGMRPQLTGRGGTQVAFYPTTIDTAKQLLRIYGVNNPTQAQLDAMNKRISAGKGARLANGVPESDVDYRINYAPTLVSHYSDPVTGEVHEMPPPAREFIAFQPELSVKNPASQYRIGDGVRAYAADPGISPGMLDLWEDKGTMLHEGLYKYQGHYGTLGVQPVSTYYPYVKDPESPVDGLPYYSMSARTVGGDPGSFNNQLPWLERVWRWPSGKSTPTTHGKVYANIVRKSDLDETSYFVSPVEFGSAASNIKNVAAIKVKPELFKFNPDNPSEFIESLERLAPEHERYTELEDELDAVLEIFKRYEQLHKRHSAGERLTPAELNEYNHYRKSLPSVWNQARNTKPYSPAGYQDTAIA